MKQIALIAFLNFLLLAACRSSDKEENLQRTEAQQAVSAEPAQEAAVPPTEAEAVDRPGGAATVPPAGNLPFVGRRTFETRAAVTGTGTPHRYVDILENGDVFFGYGQQDIATGAAGERYYAGKYGSVLRCVFATLEDTRYYIVGRTTIVEVDESGRKLMSEDCCTNEKVDLETQCPCEGNLFEAAP